MGTRGAFVLRTADAADLDQIGSLLAERGEDADAEDMRLVAEDPDEGLDSIAVVTEGGRIVSTATLLAETLVVDGVPIPAGQVELVATASDHEGRGHVRALMEWAHERSAARGDLLQVMIGIPYFYRRFGYSYCMPIPLGWEVHDVPTAADDISVRDAVEADIGALGSLQDATQSTAQVRMPHSPACWRWLVRRSGSRQIVAVRGGEVVASARMLPPDEGSVLAEMAGAPDGLRALIVHAAAQEAPVTVLERPGTDLDGVLDECATPPAEPERDREQFYARIPDLAALLRGLRPVFERRFREGGSGAAHDVLISSFRSNVRFSISDDGMSEVVAGGALQAPVWQGGSGVPPESLPSLVLGPLGAAGLERAHPDVILGRQRELMHVLFPPCRSDLLTFYVPV